MVLYVASCVAAVTVEYFPLTACNRTWPYRIATGCGEPGNGTIKNEKTGVVNLPSDFCSLPVPDDSQMKSLC